MIRANFIIALLGVILLVIVINMVRTRRLQERYALLWLVAGIGLMIAPLFIPFLDRMASALGFAYTPALLLMLAVVGLLLLIFQLSLSITHNSEQMKVLTQELGLLRHEMEVLAQRGGASGTSSSRSPVPGTAPNGAIAPGNAITLGEGRTASSPRENDGLMSVGGDSA